MAKRLASEIDKSGELFPETKRIRINNDQKFKKFEITLGAALMKIAELEKLIKNLSTEIENLKNILNKNEISDELRLLYIS